jgi:hypothetical protein
MTLGPGCKKFLRRFVNTSPWSYILKTSDDNLMINIKARGPKIFSNKLILFCSLYKKVIQS